jgi:hypothetical protein
LGTSDSLEKRLLIKVLAERRRLDSGRAWEAEEKGKETLSLVLVGWGNCKSFNQRAFSGL